MCSFASLTPYRRGYACDLFKPKPPDLGSTAPKGTGINLINYMAFVSLSTRHLFFS